MAQGSLAGRDNFSSVRPAVAPPITHRSPVPGEQGNFPPPYRQAGSLGLAVKGQTWTHWVFPHVSLPLFRMLKPLLHNPCMIARGVCSRSGVMGASWFHISTQSLICWGFARPYWWWEVFSTVEVYVAANAACHIGFDGTTLGQHPLIHRFMKGTRHSLPITRRAVPEWDLSMVLETFLKNLLSPWRISLLSFCLSRQICFWLWLLPNVSVSCMHSLFIPSALNSLSVETGFS